MKGRRKGEGQRKEKPENGTWRMEEGKRWWDQEARKGRMRELEAPRAGAGARTGEALTLLFTSTMLSGLRAGVLCGLAMAGPGGPGSVPQAARRGAGAQPGGPARAAPPLTVAFAPPSHPDLDVRGAAMESGTRSPRFLGNVMGMDASSSVLTSLRYGLRIPGPGEGFDQSEWRVMNVLLSGLCTTVFPPK